MNFLHLHRFIMLIALISVSSAMCLAEQITKNKVKITYKPLEDGSIRVINVWNENEKPITLQIDGNSIIINAGSSHQPNSDAKRFVRYDFNKSSGELLWKYTEPKKDKVAEEPTTVTIEVPEESNSVKNIKKDKKTTDVPEKRKFKPSESTPMGYVDKLNQDPFFGADAVTSYCRQVDDFYKSLESSKNKKQFIIDNELNEFLERSGIEINEKRSNLASIAQDIVGISNPTLRNQTAIDLVVETLSGRLRTREEAYSKLKAVVNEVNDSPQTAHDFSDDIMNYCIVGGVVLLLIILTIVIIIKKKKTPGQKQNIKSNASIAQETSSSDPAIVVRRRTTSILKKQCIDDVIDNPNYMLISAADFTANSAIGNIYIKNSCIKDIYNLYAEDLRNSANPKEDGCMVLGRWVYDDKTHTYDISLEDVVFPGDDAVFKEYELNFGGKIKLRIADKLRKLRRDTNLQYDLVCWIHSHPGLGVFFSNSDDNVQMQLKHSQHPNFLTAFVVDILTPDQELGIFTFRKDGSINSKGDLTKLYSLEEMYKWALQSEKNSFNPDNYYNILKGAKRTNPSCIGIELNNSSIIDLNQIILEANTGIIGWAIGTTIDSNKGLEFIVSRMVREKDRSNTGTLGCIISMTHMSFPTIQRMMANIDTDISFIMVHSSKQMTLTSIPVINGEPLADEQYYGDVNIEDLKIWTRRKR